MVYVDMEKIKQRTGSPVIPVSVVEETGIRKLEDELGVMLLERTSRKVLFTQAGLELVAQARKVLSEAQRFREMAGCHGEQMSGPLHLGLIPTVGPYLLPHLIPGLRHDFPKLEFYLHEAQTHQIVAQLESGSIDCAILALVKETAAFVELPLFEEAMVLAVPSEKLDQSLDDFETLCDFIGIEKS